MRKKRTNYEIIKNLFLLSNNNSNHYIVIIIMKWKRGRGTYYEIIKIQFLLICFIKLVYKIKFNL